MGILSKGSKPDNFESPNSVKLIFTNIWGLCSNCIECESFLKSNSRDILALCKTNLDESIDSSNFSVRGLLLLIWKDYYSYVWSCSLYEGRTFSLMGLISRMLCRFLLIFLTGYTYSLSYFFSPYWSPSLSLCADFDSVLSNIDKVLSISPSANVFVIGDFKVHHGDWLTYSGVTDLVNSLINISNNLTQMVNFPTQIPDYNSQSCSFGFIFFFDLFVLQCLSLHWEILIMLSHWKLNAPFHDIACYYSAVELGRFSRLFERCSMEYL